MGRPDEFLSLLALPVVLPTVTTALVPSRAGPDSPHTEWVIQSYQVAGSSPLASEALIGTVDIFIGPSALAGSLDGRYWIDGTFGCSLPLVADFVERQRVVPWGYSIWAAVTNPAGLETYIFKGQFIEQGEDEE